MSRPAPRIPFLKLKRRKSLNTLSAVPVSRLPMGSSSSSSAGLVTSARATATRCCWPPASCRDNEEPRPHFVRRHCLACEGSASSNTSSCACLDIANGLHGSSRAARRAGSAAAITPVSVAICTAMIISEIESDTPNKPGPNVLKFHYPRDSCAGELSRE